MIKPRSAIARIGVGLAIVAGLSMGAPAASFAQEEFDTSQVSSISQMLELPHVRTTRIQISLFNVLARAQLAIARSTTHLQFTFGLWAIRESRYVCTWTVPMTIEERAT